MESQEPRKPQKPRSWARNRSIEWYRERRSWELNEEAHAEVRKLRTLIKVRLEKDSSVDSQALLKAAQKSLDAAGKLLDQNVHRRAPIGSHVNVMRIHINTARSLWMRSYLSSPGDIAPYLAGFREVVREHLSRNDERRAKVEKIQSLDTPNDLIVLAEAVEAAYSVALRERIRLASFVRTVWVVTWFSLALAIAVGLLATKYPNASPLCFAPLTTSEVSGTPDQAASKANFSIVCPIESGDAGRNVTNDDFENATTRGDYWLVEIIGFVAAGIASVFALRKMRGTAGPYKVHVALAALKPPVGALVAIGGLVLMRGGFVPGLSALDSTAQILAWAFIFGYSQELFTQFVDKRGQAMLENVRGPGSSTSGAPSPDGPAANAQA